MSEISTDNIGAPESPKEQYFRMGTVTALFPTINTAQVTFDGETTASEKQYAYLNCYKPTVGDRVLLAALSGTYIVIDKVNYNVSPPTSEVEAGSFTTLLASELATLDGGIKVLTSVSFFGAIARAQISVSDPTSITTTETADTTYSSNEVTMLNHLKTDVTNLQSKLKALIDALQSYGLIGT